MDLLLEHKLIQTKFAHLDPLNLEPFHLRKTINNKQISVFMAAFDNKMDNLAINLVAGQFSVMVAQPIPPPLSIKPNIRAHLLGLLERTNRPLTMANIKQELRGIISGDIELAMELGRLTQTDTVIVTFAEKVEAQRFFLSARLGEIFGQLLDKPLLFQYEDGSGEAQYVFIKEAKELTTQDKVHKVLRTDGTFSCVAKGHLDLNETTLVRSSKGPMLVLTSEIDSLVAKGLITRGQENKTFEPCLIDSRDQKEYAQEIFNVFARQFLGEKAEESSETYNKLAAAFKAGIRATSPESIVEFLYEARMAASLDGSLTAIVLALIKSAAAVKAIKKTGLFAPEEIEKLEACQNHLAFMDRFPLLFMPGYAHALQNFIHFIYDQTEYFEVFQLLLVSKLNQLRRLAQIGGKLPVPPNFRRQIELVYAPLAERTGYIDLANNMRDLIARLDSPEIYNSILESMESTIGMTRNEARAHLINCARTLKANIETDTGVAVLAAHTRVKEIYAIRTNIEASLRTGKQFPSQERYSQEAKSNTVDFLGIRLICETVEEAEAIASHLQDHSKSSLVHPNAKILPHGSKMVENNLRQARSSGWNAWRGYFIDPHDPENKRVFSIQVMTREMLKKDKKGKGVAHWAYKARVAAKEAAHNLNAQSKQQRFDAAPLDHYTDNAEHNYYVNQAMARRHKRVFIWFANWGNPGTESSLKEVFPPIDGLMPMLRLEKGETIEDAVAFRAYNNSLTNGYSHTEVYKLAVDQKNGAITPQPYSKGQARAKMG
ncbi:MAG: hypothetical protein KKA31_04915, partial [Candidatus Margulisbacteria bacterium]|nr:hypothetical protein [Candidatus Margulisiibacteriota bacterium]